MGEVAIIGPDEGDNPAARAPAVNEFPTLSRNRTATRTRPTGAAITARAGAGFSRSEAADTKKPSALAKNSTTVRKRSFFRTRATLKK
jgi:hypothetical protein